MVKLATAREARMYGPALAVRRWEYANAAAYAFATLLLLLAAAMTLLPLSASGGGAARAVAGVALSAIAAVNAHDLAAHLAGIDCHVGLVRHDIQLGLVELLVPALHVIGCALAVAALATSNNAMATAAAAAAAWVVGSVANACQTYERADSRAQLMQSGVQVPMLVGSLLFLVSAAVVDVDTSPAARWRWVVVVGSVMWVVAAAVNVAKVYMMHQSDALRLEKLRGGAQEWLGRDREGRVPLSVNWEEAAWRAELR
uniref:Uncharacterized protein n=1 Tax=Leersia perrieri TaxID=77586 RepID=A0A0D9WKC6_9ORYZ